MHTGRNPDAQSRWDRATVAMLGIAAALLVVSVSRLANGEVHEVQSETVPRTASDASSEFESSIAGRRIDAGDSYRLRETGQLLGSSETDVSIVVFSNFGCGYCAKYHRVLEEVLARYPDHVNVRFRNYVPTMDRLTLRIHLAAECAAEQGRFSDFTAYVFNNPDVLTSRYGWREVAERVQVTDMPRFVACTESKTNVGRIQADNDEAARLGVTGTPTSFVNGVRVIGAAEIGSLDSLIAFHLDRLH